MDKWLKKEINIKTKWADFLPSIRNDERYLEMFHTTGSRPAELFYDFIDDLEEKFEQDKYRVKEMMKDLNLPMTPNLTFESWCAVIKQHEGYNTLDHSNLEYMFNDVRIIACVILLLRTHYFSAISLWIDSNARMKNGGKRILRNCVNF